MSNKSKISELQNLPETGLLRLKQILQFIPVSRSSWYYGVKTGRFPKPFKIGERTNVWRAADINELVNRGVQNESKNHKEV